MAQRGTMGAVMSIFGVTFLLVYVPYKLLSTFILYMYLGSTGSTKDPAQKPDFVNNDDVRNEDHEIAPLITRSGILVI